MELICQEKGGSAQGVEGPLCSAPLFVGTSLMLPPHSFSALGNCARWHGLDGMMSLRQPV
jgi:hypothetical protein